MSALAATTAHATRSPMHHHSFNIRLADPSVHAYAQKYCFLHGPDLDLNRRLREEVLDSRVALSEERDADRIAYLGEATLDEVEAQLCATLQAPSSLGVPDQKLRTWIQDLGWKVAKIPLEAKSVLVLGSASCREAIFIRHRLPHARIVCADFVDARLPNVEAALGIEFALGDFHELLAASTGAFDVVFSNHVLEHLFDPARTLSHVRKALSPNGVLISALPLDGQPSCPFSTALAADSVHPLDFCTVDVGHAWKTNVSELIRQLRAVGFDDLGFFGRESYYSAAHRRFASRAAFDRRARLGMLCNRALFGSARKILKRWYPQDVPSFVLKVVFGLEHRAWFGSNRLKNEFSLETLFVAR